MNGDPAPSATGGHPGHWHRTEYRRPPSGVPLWTMDTAGTVTELVFDRGLWWFPDRKMYVYYVPTYWQEIIQ